MQSGFEKYLKRFLSPTFSRIRVPQTRTLIRWPEKRDGIVRVRTLLPLKGSAKGIIVIPIELRMSVRSLRSFMRGADVDTQAMRSVRMAKAVERALILCATTPPRLLAIHRAERRRGVVVIRAFYSDVEPPRELIEDDLRMLVSIRETDLAGLGVLLSTDHDVSRRLAFELRVNLFPAALTEWSGLKRRPRGKSGSLAAQHLQRVARVAMLVADGLILRARDDAKLRRRVWAALEDDVEPGALTRQVAIALVDRSLRPAWEHFGKASLVDREPADVYRELLSRTPAKRLRNMDPETMQSWERRLLGPAGQAARDFDLI